MKLQNNTSSYFSRCDGHLKKNLHTRPARGFRKKNYNPPTAVLVIGKDGQVSDRLGPCRPQTQIYPSFGMGPVVLVPNESATNLLGPVWAQHLSKPGLMFHVGRAKHRLPMVWARHPAWTDCHPLLEVVFP